MGCSKNFITFVALCCFHIATVKAQTPNVEMRLDESSARDLMEQIDDVFKQSATEYRKLEDDTLSPEILMREKLRPFYKIMEKYDWKNFEDPLLKRQFEVILRGAKYPPIDENFKRATANLKTLSHQKWACKRNAVHTCNMAFVPQIKSILRNSDGLDEILYYWKEWRNKLPSDAKESLLYYVNYYKNLSTPLMNATAIWYDQYEDPNFNAELEQLMEAITPFYRKMHAHIRHVLRLKYGDVIPTSGLIPHHLFEQVTYQAWKKDSVLKNPCRQPHFEFLGYQIYGAICHDVGEYQKGVSQKALNNCDFANSLLAGTVFKEMMKVGSSKPWREIIKPLTLSQTTKLTATAFLEYFEPLHNWLKEDKNIHVGYITDDKCKSGTTNS